MYVLIHVCVYHLFLIQVYIVLCTYACACASMYVCVLIYYTNTFIICFYRRCMLHVACMCSYMCVCIICFYSGVCCVVYLCMCVRIHVCMCFNLLYQHFYNLFLSQVHVACMCSYMCVCIICFYSGVYCVVYLCMCVRIHVCRCFNLLYQHFYHLFLSQVHVACMCSYMCVCIICFYSGVYCGVYLCMCVRIHVCMFFNLLYQHCYYLFLS